MPWLTATALLHALVMQDQRGTFRWWSMVLTLLSFLLVLFGTFTTRSGLIQSVHAFALSPLGPYFLAAMGVTLLCSLWLFYSRRRLLSTPESSEDLLSREGTFTLTLILFLTITASVLIGSVLPTLTAGMAQGQFEAGSEWFDRVTGPQFGALVLLMGVCPLLGRAVAAMRRLKERGLPTLAGGILVPTVAALAGFTRPFSLVGFAIVGLAGGTALAEITRAVVQRTRQGEGPLQALWRVFGRNRRRYGGYLVHVGVILMAIGVIGTRFYPFETEAVLSSGESVEVEGYSLFFGGLEQDTGNEPLATQATVAVYKNKSYVGTLYPRIDDYSSYLQTVAVPAIRTELKQDLYVVLAGWTDGGSLATLKVILSPLAVFLWIGGLVLLAGGTIALWPETQLVEAPAPEARMRRVWSTVGIVLILALIVLAAWAMWGKAEATATSVEALGDSGEEATAVPGGRPRVGDLAPDLSVELLDGSSFSLSDAHGQVTVINFWSPDCEPCREELPDLQAIWESYHSKGVVFLGISLPSLGEDVQEMVSEFGVTYPVALDATGPVEYGITGVPETFVLGPNGDVAYVHVGPVTAEQLGQELDALLAE